VQEKLRLGLGQPPAGRSLGCHKLISLGSAPLPLSYGRPVTGLRCASWPNVAFSAPLSGSSPLAIRCRAIAERFSTAAARVSSARNAGGSRISNRTGSFMPWLLRCRLSSVTASLFSDEKKARTCRAEEVCSCVPTTNTGQWWPNGATIAQDRQRPQTAKKKAPAGTGLVGAKVAIHEYPSQGASKDGHLHSVRPVCGGSAKPCPAPQFSGSGPHASKKKRSRTSIRGQAGHDAHQKRWAQAASAGSMAEMRSRDNISKKSPDMQPGPKSHLRGPI
jgi:hypothetical protein